MSKETLGILIAIVVGVMGFAIWLADRSGKTTPTLTFLVLVLIAGLCLCGAYLIPWIWAQNLAEKIWRVCLVTTAVLLMVGRFGIWVWPPSQAEPSVPSKAEQSNPVSEGTEKSVVQGTPLSPEETIKGVVRE